MNPREIVFASSNRGKFREIENTCAEFGIQALFPDSLAETYGPPPEVAETGRTYLENARLKAEAFFSWCGLPVLADDTGLEVKALGGEPGLHTARYAGPEQNPEANRKKLLMELSETADRRARFVCVLSLKLDSNDARMARGELHGEITRQERGGGGFGYDGLFQVQGLGKTLAECKESGITVVTHRIAAVRALCLKLT